MNKIKVNVITGFLGSGKTTAILNLLKQKDESENWAIIVNEFGEISIDYITLSGNEKTGKVYEINGGCICCSAKSYFHENLNTIVQSKKFDRIIIEPTGLGGSDMVTEIILSNADLSLQPTICLVDHKMLEIKRLQLIPLFRIQIESADILVLSKCDLLEDPNQSEKILDRLKQEFPGKISYTTSAKSFIDKNLLNEGRPLLKDKVWGLDPSNKKVTSKTFTFSVDSKFDIEKLLHLLKSSEDIIRAKGFVNSISGWKLVNHTLTETHIKICGELPQSVITIFAETNRQDFFELIESEINLAIN